VSFESASYRVRESSSGSTLEVCVQLTGGLEIPLSVTFSTQNNTALGEGVRRRYLCLLKKVHILNHSCYCEAIASKNSQSVFFEPFPLEVSPG